MPILGLWTLIVTGPNSGGRVRSSRKRYVGTDHCCRCETNTSVPAYVEVGDRTSEKGTVESRVEALVENLAMAVMQADHLAADAPEYGVLAETLAYALELADLGLSAESDVFGSVGPPKAR